MGSFGPPRLLFNNAGTGMPGVLGATDEALKKAFDINLFSVIDAMRLFVPEMEKLEEECHIVNTASLAGISESTGLYGVTKHAVVAATESVASELAWRRSNVRVSVLCPSYVATNVAATTRRASRRRPPPRAPSASPCRAAGRRTHWTTRPTRLSPPTISGRRCEFSHSLSRSSEF